MNSFGVYSSIFEGRQCLPPRRTENGERSAPAGRRVGRRENGRASKLGQTQRCAAITKSTKNHKDTQSTTQFRAQRHTEGYTEEHRDGLPVYFGNHKGHEGPPCRREATNLPRLRGTKGMARRRGRAVRARKAHVRPGDLGGMAGFARHALGEGALTRPGEQRTENGEQRARGKRATVKPLCVSGVGHRPVVLQRRSSGDSGDSGAPLWGDGWRRQGAKPMGGRERSAGV